MSHFAKINNGIVEQVIVAEQDVINSMSGQWIQTSYNTKGGIHYQPNSNIPSDDQSKALRKNYAGIGMVYDDIRDAFYATKPYDSWILNEQSCIWESPIPRPNDDQEYEWNESILNWKIVNNETGA
jgi:hypothetical protein